LTQRLGVSGRQRAEPVPRRVDRLVADAVFLRDAGNRPLVGLPQDRHDLLLLNRPFFMVKGAKIRIAVPRAWRPT